MKKSLRSTTPAFFALLLFALFLQWRGGAFQAEFSHADESAHFVTSLMIHAYVMSGMAVPPRTFAEEYYVRYPKVAFGIWPPLFHVSQALWMLAFSPSRISVFILMALWTALLATGCFVGLRHEFGWAASLCLALLLVSLPRVQAETNRDMPDLMMSCFMFAATLFFGRYLQTNRTRDSFLFGLMASLSIMVKYNALALGLVPAFAILLSGRFHLLRRPSFWLPAGVVAAICGPWYLINRTLVRYAMEPDPGVKDIPMAIFGNSMTIASFAGIPLLIVAAVGVWSIIRSRKDAGLWTAAFSLLAAVWVFHSFLYPINTSRYMLSAAPAWILFVAAGSRVIAKPLTTRMQLRYAPILAAVVCACIVYGFTGFRINSKIHYGISNVAELMSSGPCKDGSWILVSGSSETEGMMISEMALLDPHRRNVMLRGSKVLAHSTWMGASYEVLFRTTDEVLNFLNQSPISVVAVDRTQGSDLAHNRLLFQALSSRPELWNAVSLGVPGNIQVFERVQPLPVTASTPISIDLSRTIGMSLALRTN